MDSERKSFWRLIKPVNASHFGVSLVFVFAHALQLLLFSLLPPLLPLSLLSTLTISFWLLFPLSIGTCYKATGRSFQGCLSFFSSFMKVVETGSPHHYVQLVQSFSQNLSAASDFGVRLDVWSLVTSAHSMKNGARVSVWGGRVAPRNDSLLLYAESSQGPSSQQPISVHRESWSETLSFL